MTDTDEDDFDDGDEPRPFSWAEFAHNVTGSVGAFFRGVSDQLWAHSEFRRNRRKFADSVMSDIKNL